MSDNAGRPDEDEQTRIVGEAERQGRAALGRGDSEGAARIFTHLIEIAPKNTVALNGLSEVSLLRGDDRLAERFARAATEASPADAAGHCSLGAALLAAGRARRAAQSFRRAAELDPEDAEIWHALALAEQAHGQRDAARDALGRALAIAPDHVRANNDLGCLLVATGEMEKAEAHLKRATSRDEAGADPWCNLGNVLLMRGRPADAAAAYGNATERMPDHVAALKGLAMAERQRGHLEAARLAAEKALALAGDADAHNLLGTVLREQGLFDEAAENFDAALALAPQFPPARVNRALLSLLRGDWASGFQDYEARFKDSSYQSPWGHVARPLWDGRPLDGRTLLLLSEQGYGDTIQFSRLIPRVTTMGGTVLVAIQPELKPLISTMETDVRFVEPGVPLPAVDCIAPLMSLPHVLRLTRATEVSGEPYLKAPEPSAAIRERLGDGGGLKVGLAWRGSARHKENWKRSLPRDALRPLLAVAGARFFSLDVGPEADGPDGAPPDGVRDMRDLIADFADSAAVVGALDLVISVDTAAVHLAGAIGIPCLALIPSVPDWRWGLSGTVTPWYDSVRLLRQPAFGDWDSAIAEARRQLERRMQGER